MRLLLQYHQKSVNVIIALASGLLLGLVHLRMQCTALQGNMGYRDLLIGLMYEGEVLQTHNQFSHLTYSHLVYANESNVTECTKPGGIGLITNKRLLLLSSQRQMGRYHSMFKKECDQIILASQYVYNWA